MAYSGLANKGLIYQPQFIQPADEKSFEPKKVAEIQLSDNKTWKKMEQALVDVISARNGTAHKVFDPNSVVIAGKTGTALISSASGYKHGKVNVSFVGMAPVVSPELVVSVFVGEPKSGARFGSKVAAPVFSKIVGDVLVLLGS